MAQLPKIDVTGLAAVQDLASDLQTALTCLDDVLGGHDDPCEPISDADLRCTESWMDIDDDGRCTHRVAHDLLTKHDIR